MINMRPEDEDEEQE